MLPAHEPLKPLVGSGGLKGTGEMPSSPDNPAAGHCPLGGPGQIYEEDTYSLRLSASGFMSPEGPGDRFRRSGSRVGTGSFVIEITPFSGKNVRSFLSPDGIQHPKGYARLLGSGGGEGASALPVIQLVRRKVGPGRGPEARGREEIRKTPLSLGAANLVGVKREEKKKKNPGSVSKQQAVP